MKKKTNGWICGLLPSVREYKLNGVTYIVSSRFEAPNSENSIRSRFEQVISNEMIDLTAQPTDCTMAAEYVYSAAGKED